MRTKHQIKLDHKSKIFQNLNGATTEVELSFQQVYPKLLNTMYDTEPLVLHGNGPSKRILNTLGRYTANTKNNPNFENFSLLNYCCCLKLPKNPSFFISIFLANYIPKAWNTDDHCTACWEDTIAFNELTESPLVMVAIFIEKPTPFIEEFFDKIANLDYDKDKLALFIHNNVEYHEEDVDSFLEDHKSKYISVDVLNPKDSIKEWHARNKGIQKCQSLKCDFYFSVDSDAHVDNPESLKLLIGICIFILLT